MKSCRRNAIIMAAGTSSRFVPLSAEFPKGLLVVKGEVLIERQIRQLREADIDDITIVTGYKADAFEYLKQKFKVDIVLNEDYVRYNNTSSLIRVLGRLNNTFICSSDNYFPENVFLEECTQSYYSALYAQGATGEYCISTDCDDNISGINIGGYNSWYMIGHVYLNSEFSKKFVPIMLSEYPNDSVRLGYWEDVYIKHIDELPKLKIKRYEDHQIYEFDTLDELRQFDSSYINNTKSAIIQDIASQLKCQQSELSGFTKERFDCDEVQFTFNFRGKKWRYHSTDKFLTPA